MKQRWQGKEKEGSNIKIQQWSLPHATKSERDSAFKVVEDSNVGARIQGNLYATIGIYYFPF